MQRFVFAGINGIVRLDKIKTEETISGLGTKGLVNCIAVIVRNQNRMSLTHLTAISEHESILTEIKWVGESFEIILVKNQTAMNKAIEENSRLFTAIKNKTKLNEDTEKNVIQFLKQNNLTSNITKRYNTTSGLICFDREGNISTKLNENQKIFHAPNLTLYGSIHIINSACRNNPILALSPILEFDTNQFTSLIALYPESKTVAVLIHQYLTMEKKEISTTNLLAAFNYIAQDSKTDDDLKKSRLLIRSENDETKSADSRLIDKRLLEAWEIIFSANENDLKVILDSTPVIPEFLSPQGIKMSGNHPST